MSPISQPVPVGFNFGAPVSTPIYSTFLEGNTISTSNELPECRVLNLQFPCIAEIFFKLVAIKIDENTYRLMLTQSPYFTDGRDDIYTTSLLSRGYAENCKLCTSDSEKLHKDLANVVTTFNNGFGNILRHSFG